MKGLPTSAFIGVAIMTVSEPITMYVAMRRWMRPDRIVISHGFRVGFD